VRFLEEVEVGQDARVLDGDPRHLPLEPRAQLAQRDERLVVTQLL
jgi:hypothetical protein